VNFSHSYLLFYVCLLQEKLDVSLIRTEEAMVSEIFSFVYAFLCLFVAGEAKDSVRRAEGSRRGNGRLVNFFHLYLLFYVRLLQEKRAKLDIGLMRTRRGNGRLVNYFYLSMLFMSVCCRRSKGLRTSGRGD
jgi:hypothetical protein